MFNEKYEFDEEFNTQFLNEIKSGNIRQKVLIIHLAIEYWINEILKIKLEDLRIANFILENLTFYKKYELLKKMDLLNPDNIYDKRINENIIKSIKNSMKNTGISVLQEIETRPKNRKKEGQFSFFLICSNDGILNNITILNKLRNKYAHQLLIDENNIKELAKNLQPIFNSDIWVLDYKEKIDIIGANTVFLLKYLYLHYSGHLNFEYDESKGIVLHFRGPGKFSWIYHFKIPSTWNKIERIKVEAKGTKKSTIKIEIEKVD